MSDLSLEKKALKEEQDRRSNWLVLVVSAPIILLGGIYLVAVLLNRVGAANRFGMTEAVMFVALLVFIALLTGGLERLSISGKGIELEVRKVKEVQSEQQKEIESLRFLMAFFVSEAELDHLRRLEVGGVVPYERPDEWYMGILRNELRRLCSLGLLVRQRGKGIAEMPQKGNLDDYLKITERGRDYLRLRRKVTEE